MNSWDGILSVLNPAGPVEKHAAAMKNLHAQYKFGESAAASSKITIPVYEHGHSGVVAIQESLREFKDALAAALVHGSHATGEVVPYSDFDGLLVIKDEVFGDTERLATLAMAIYRSQAGMYRMDPLQHHGWFILTERDYLAYPVSYLPIEVLAQSRSLLGDTALQLELRPELHPDFFGPVKSMCRRFRRLASKGNRPKNLYQLKSLLSEFMMLPALYVQARDQRGIFKRESFDAAARDFSEGYWSIMTDVSALRAEWKQEIKDAEKARLEKTGYLWMQYRKKSGPAIPANLAGKLDEEFYRRMIVLANQVEVNLFR